MPQGKTSLHASGKNAKSHTIMTGSAALCLVIGLIHPACTTAALRSTVTHVETVENAADAEPKQVWDIVVARVNGIDITLESLAKMMNRIVGLQDGDGSPEVRKKALDALILQELAYQKAVAEGLHADFGDVDDLVAGLKQKLENEEAYQQYLAQEGLNEADFRLRTARNLTIERILTCEVLSKAVVPEDELRAEYERRKAKYVTQEKIVVIDIVFAGDPADEKLQRKAEAVLSRVCEDPSRDPWKLLLDGTFLVTKAEIRKDRDGNLYEASRKLKPGDLSGVIRTADAYHILKLLEYRKARQMTFDELKPVLKKKLAGRYREKRLHEWGEELKENAFIEVYTEKSDEPAGQKKGNI